MWRAASSASHSACDSRAYRYAGVSLTSAGVVRCPDELDAVALRRTGRFAGREAPSLFPIGSASVAAWAVAAWGVAAAVAAAASAFAPAVASTTAGAAVKGRLF